MSFGEWFWSAWAPAWPYLMACTFVLLLTKQMRPRLTPPFLVALAVLTAVSLKPVIGVGAFFLALVPLLAWSSYWFLAGIKARAKC